MAEAMNVQALAGLGITGEIAQKRALVGKAAFIKQLAVGQIRSLHRHNSSKNQENRGVGGLRGEPLGMMRLRIRFDEAARTISD